MDLNYYEEEAQRIISLGRAYIMDFHKEPCAPYISDTLLNLTPVPIPTLQHSMGVTSGLVMYFNPIRIVEDPELSQKHIMAACLVHECEHILRGMWRLDALPDKDLANIAGDFAINCVLRNEGWTLPSWVYYPDMPQFNFPLFLTLEQYYDLLQEKANNDYGGSTQKMMNDLCGSDEEGEDGGGGSSGDGEGDGQGGQGSAQDGDPNGQGSAQGGKWRPDIGSGGCGSVAGGVPDSQLEQQLDQQHGRSEVEVESIRRNTLDALEDWISNKGIGADPGRWQEMLENKLKKPDVNWKALLRRVVRRTVGQVKFGSRDYSIRRPSISSPFLGVVIPSLIDQDVEIAFIRDTSASMGKRELNSSNNETIGAMKKAGVQSCWLIDADTEVHQCRRVRLRDIPKVPVVGRGGTNFVQALQFAAKLRPKPNVVIYLTDGHGFAPAFSPANMQVIWCIVRTPHARKPAHWGTTVVCHKNQKLDPPLPPVAA